MCSVSFVPWDRGGAGAHALPRVSGLGVGSVCVCVGLEAVAFLFLSTIVAGALCSFGWRVRCSRCRVIGQGIVCRASLAGTDICDLDTTQVRSAPRKDGFGYVRCGLRSLIWR